MEVKIGDITDLLESIAPLSFQEHYDNAGLFCGSKDEVCSGVIVCLDVSEKVIDKAIEKGCNLIVSHHPLVFRGLKSLLPQNNVAKTVLKAVTNNICLYSSHTNLDAAKELDIPICQDTGMAVVFLEIGQDVHFVGGSLNEAVNKGVHDGYVNGYLRCSVVGDPLRRVNTKDNTPAVIHTHIVDGDKVKITVAPKGFGSENMSCLKMMTPARGREDIIEYILSCVRTAGGNPCPPIVLGIGIGGDFEQCA